MPAAWCIRNNGGCELKEHDAYESTSFEEQL